MTMRFYFVDKIQEYDDHTIRGAISFHQKTFWQDNKQNILGGIIGEALGQLASWLVIKKTNFQFRPVFVFCDKMQFLGEVKGGSTIDLRAMVKQLTDESFVFSAEAFDQRGHKLAVIEDCATAFMPLHEMEDRTITEQRFNNLLSRSGVQCDHEERMRFDVAQYIDKEKNRYRVCYPHSLGFYNDHFPKFPVTPIVLINEAIRYCLMDHMKRSSLFLSSVRQLKIKNFVRPDEVFEVELVQPGSQSDECNRQVVQVFLDDKRILRGEYYIT